MPGAVEHTAATAGRTVTFSALTVATALSGLFVFTDPTFTSVAVAGPHGSPGRELAVAGERR